MSRKNNSHDDKLIEELYEKLDWFTFQATEEEFDAKQVKAILQLLDSLDPMNEAEKAGPDKTEESQEASQPVKEEAAFGEDPAAAFKRFREKYHISEADLAEKDGKADGNGKIINFHTDFAGELAFDSQEAKAALEYAQARSSAALELAAPGAEAAQAAGAEEIALSQKPEDINTKSSASDSSKYKNWKKIMRGPLGKVACTVAIVIAATTGLSISGNADSLKSFLEIVRDGGNGMKITVTGNEMEMEMESQSEGLMINNEEQRTYYNSWDELEEQLDISILKPSYLPEGMRLKSLYSQTSESYNLCEGKYKNEYSNDTLTLRIDIYYNNYAKISISEEDDWNKIKTDGNTVYYNNNGLYKITWIDGRCINHLIGKDINLLKDVKLNMYK